MLRYILVLTIIFCIFCFSACYTPDYKPEDMIIPSLSEQSSNTICDEINNVTDSDSESLEEGIYGIGDSIPLENLLMESDYCYPDDSLGHSFSFANHPNKVFMIEMSASW